MRRWFKGRLDPGATVMDKEEADTLNPGQKPIALPCSGIPERLTERLTVK